MDFKVEGPCNAEKYCRPPWLDSRRSRVAKTVTFWPLWQPFHNFCFENLSFFFVSFFSFWYAKKSVCVCGVEGGRGMPPPPISPNVAGPVKNGNKHSYNNVSYNYFGSPTQVDHNSRRSQYLRVFFILFSCFSCGKLGKILVTCNVLKPGLFKFSFLTKEQERKKERKNSTHFSLIWHEA